MDYLVRRLVTNGTCVVMDLVAADSGQRLRQAATETSVGGQPLADSHMASFVYNRSISDDMRLRTLSCVLPCPLRPLWSCGFQELAEREGAVQGGEARLRSLQHQLEAQEQQLANRERTLQHQQEVS